MKFRKEVTFTGYSQYKKAFNGRENWTELSFLEHNAYNYTGLKALSYTVSDEKFKAILDYAKIPSLEINKKYEIWIQDYHDNRKFTLNSIKKI